MTDFNNPFGNFFGNKTSSKKEEVVEIPVSKPEQKVSEKTKEQLQPEDQVLFDSLCKMISLSEKDSRYWKVWRCFKDSRRVDDSYEINRWLGRELRDQTRPREVQIEVERIIQLLLRRGYEAQAAEWLASRSPERMKFGTGSRELRLEEAKKMAEKAGKSIEEIAKIYGLENLLN